MTNSYITDTRFEEIRQILADFIEDTGIRYPLNPFALAEQLGCAPGYYRRQDLPFLRSSTFTQPSDLHGLSARMNIDGRLPYSIALDEQQRDSRKPFTLTHELGHLILDHPGDSRLSVALEKEADFAASFLLLPEVIAEAALPNVTVAAIQNYCSVSLQAAEAMFHRIQGQNRRRGEFLRPYELQILRSALPNHQPTF